MRPLFINQKHLQMLQVIAGKLSNCYIIDLYHEAPEHDAEFKKRYFCGGHMNAMGYLVTAWQMMTYIDGIIRDHPEEFRFVQFIGSGKKSYSLQ